MLFSSGFTVSFRWCLFMAVFIGWSSDLNAGEKSRSQFHALCVGLRYPGSGRQLRFTTSDVRAVAEALTAASGYDDLSSDIVCLVDDDPLQPKPTPDEVRRRLGRMAANTGPEDRLVFYFSGHGLRGADDRSILVCDDGGSGGDAGNLYVSEIRDILDQSPAKDKLLILDACHSGGKSVGASLAPSSLAKSLAGASKAAGRDTVAWLVSSDVSEQSWEDEESKQGLFTRFFLEAIGSRSALADTNFDGMLSVPELNKYISNAIGHYIHDRKMRNDRDWLTRSQSPRMGLGGLVSMNGEELRKTTLFYCPPDSYPSSPPAPSPRPSSAKPPTPPAARVEMAEERLARVGTDKPGNIDELRSRLEVQLDRLEFRLGSEIPRAREQLTDDFDRAFHELQEARSDSTRAVLKDEIQSGVKRQLALDAFHKEGSDAIRRINSMLRRLRQNELMPEGFADSIDQSLVYITALGNDELSSRLDAITIDDDAIASRIANLSDTHKTRIERILREDEEKRVEEKKLRLLKAEEEEKRRIETAKRNLESSARSRIYVSSIVSGIAFLILLAIIFYKLENDRDVSDYLAYLTIMVGVSLLIHAIFYLAILLGYDITSTFGVINEDEL